MALAASVPDEPEFEFEVELDFAGGVPAPVKPTQPESDSKATNAKTRANSPTGAWRT